MTIIITIIITGIIMGAVGGLALLLIDAAARNPSFVRFARNMLTTAPGLVLTMTGCLVLLFFAGAVL